MAKPDTFPMPPALPIVGHLPKIAKSGLVGYLLEANRQTAGGVFKLKFGSRVGLFVTDADLVAELCDETRFRKMPGPGLRIVRRFAGDGLFTAFSEEPNWGKAHRILLPAFSQRAMRGYFDMILEVCDQLIAKWSAREHQDILVADDMTRLTLDSIAIAGFGHRFSSFENEALDPFLEALARALGKSLSMMTRLPIQNRFARRSQAQFDADIDEMNALVDRIIAERRANPSDSKDLLNLMLTAADPETGERLDDLNIRYQVLTFLIAGHETTSGLLTFAFHFMLRNPHVLAQAYAEVDRVLPGDTRPDYGHLVHLEVIERIIKETQRLWPTAPIFTVAPFEDDSFGDFPARKNRPINIYSPGLHRDPKVWANPDEFDIDRWLPEAESARHPHAYKPFGNGARACIGRQFALVEAKLAIAMILQNFAVGGREGYALSIKETLSIKPDAFFMRVRKRLPHERMTFAPPPAKDDAAAIASVSGGGQRLAVLYGTSLGTARDIAEEIAERARLDGFDTVVRAMDESFALGLEAEDRVIVCVTATYNGRAPDSALNVERALDENFFEAKHWPEARFAVLGVGNSQWPNYQAFPKRVDAALAGTGAKRLIERAEADGQGDFDGSVAAFLRDLWSALGQETAPAQRTAGLSLIAVDTQAQRGDVLPEQAVQLEILVNEEMTKPADGLWDFAIEAPRSSTRFIRIALPEGQTYKAGDHIAIYAHNRAELVTRALNRLGVIGSEQLVAEGASGRFRHLPLGKRVTARQLLTDFVELAEPAPKRAFEALSDATGCPHTKAELAKLSDDYTGEIADKRVTLLDLLERFPAIELPLATFVELCPAIAPRFYSIASSPLVSPNEAVLIVGTMAAPAWSGLGEHQGFASSHMQGLKAGDRVFGYLRTPNPPFAPPADPAVPMILIGPGTGFAPLRGFLEERAAQQADGEAVATSHLFFGCRHPDHDWFCRDAMERWAADGIAELHLAFSAVPDHPHRFVQDALWDDQDQVWAALEAGAQIFLCGDGRQMAPAVRDTLIQIYMQKRGDTHAQGSEWLQGLIDEGRFHQDVFGFGK